MEVEITTRIDDKKKKQNKKQNKSKQNKLSKSNKDFAILFKFISVFASSHLQAVSVANSAPNDQRGDAKEIQETRALVEFGQRLRHCTGGAACAVETCVQEKGKLKVS